MPKLLLNQTKTDNSETSVQDNQSLSIIEPIIHDAVRPLENLKLDSSNETDILLDGLDDIAKSLNGVRDSIDLQDLGEKLSRKTLLTEFGNLNASTDTFGEYQKSNFETNKEIQKLNESITQETSSILRDLTLSLEKGSVDQVSQISDSIQNFSSIIEKLESSFSPDNIQLPSVDINLRTTQQDLQKQVERSTLELKLDKAKEAHEQKFAPWLEKKAKLEEAINDPIGALKKFAIEKLILKFSEKARIEKELEELDHADKMEKAAEDRAVKIQENVRLTEDLLQVEREISSTTESPSVLEKPTQPLMQPLALIPPKKEKGGALSELVKESAPLAPQFPIEIFEEISESLTELIDVTEDGFEDLELDSDGFGLDDITGKRGKRGKGGLMKNLMGKGKGMMGKMSGMMPKGMGMPKIPLGGMGGMMGSLGSMGSAAMGGLSSLGSMASAAAVANPIGAAVLGAAALGAGGYMLYDSMRGSDESKKAFDQAEEDGVVDHSLLGDSTVLNWEALKQMKPDALQALIDYDDWDGPTKTRMEEILSGGNNDVAVEKADAQLDVAMEDERRANFQVMSRDEDGNEFYSNDTSKSIQQLEQEHRDKGRTIVGAEERAELKASTALKTEQATEKVVDMENKRTHEQVKLDSRDSEFEDYDPSQWYEKAYDYTPMGLMSNMLGLTSSEDDKASGKKSDIFSRISGTTEDGKDESTFLEKAYDYTPMGLMSNMLGFTSSEDDKASGEKNDIFSKITGTTGADGKDESTFLEKAYDYTPMGLLSNAIGLTTSEDDKLKVQEAGQAGDVSNIANKMVNQTLDNKVGDTGTANNTIVNNNNVTNNNGSSQERPPESGHDNDPTSMLVNKKYGPILMPGFG